MNRIHLILIALFSFCLHMAAQETELEQDMFETMREGDKAVVVAVHVGAEDATSQQRIDRFNTRIHQAYPSYDFREAWTSRSLIRQKNSNGVNYMPTPDELFTQLRKDGYTHVLIQSSDIVEGADMRFLRYTVDAARTHFKQVRLGDPLLNDAADYEKALHATVSAYGSTKEANVLMCTNLLGTHASQYTMLDYTLHDKDMKGWYVGAVGGYPSAESVIKRLRNEKVKKVHLIPFLFTASNQSTMDMAREWTNLLQSAGCKVTTEMHCLGDIDAIIDIFVSHIQHAEKFHKYSPKELKLINR
ncbi:MAG: sirohydrochlorin cobaltochelatase [Bacteroidaceae bacterium]|nr:sirohydrochlorin cobaltochelatase [Bacteroidaceae bacterium]